MLWYILQGAVFLAVMVFAIEYEISPNPFVGVGLAVLCAYLVTELIYGLGRAGRFLRRFFHK